MKWNCVKCKYVEWSIYKYANNDIVKKFAENLQIFPNLGANTKVSASDA